MRILLAAVGAIIMCAAVTGADDWQAELFKCEDLKTCKTEGNFKVMPKGGPDGGPAIVFDEPAKANGSIERDIEVDGSLNAAVEADVTLSVEKGTFKIELIGRNDEATLSLEASDGQVVSGHGWMAVDSFGEMSYRITAVDAENVEYTIEYTFE